MSVLTHWTSWFYPLDSFFEFQKLAIYARGLPPYKVFCLSLPFRYEIRFIPVPHLNKITSKFCPFLEFSLNIIPKIQEIQFLTQTHIQTQTQKFKKYIYKVIKWKLSEGEWTVVKVIIALIRRRRV